MAPTDPDNPDERGYVAVVGALDRELRPLRKQIGLLRRISKTGPAVWSGSVGSQKILLVRAGPGPLRARRAACKILNSFPISALIVVGYACALRPAMRIGDLVVADRILFTGPDLMEVSGRSFVPDPRLLELACRLGGRFNKMESGGEKSDRPFNLFRGSLLTVHRVVEEAMEKARLADLTGAVAVDMESAAIADQAMQAKIAFLAVRSVSDLLTEDLRGISHFVRGETGKGWITALRYLLWHPGYVRVLNRLRIQTSVASRHLGRFVHELLVRIPERRPS